jgi:hypothetical protein
VLVHRHRLVRPAALVAAALLVFALAGCSDEERAAWTQPAATVNGADISTDLLTEGVMAATGVEEPALVLAASDASGFLGELVQLEIARDELAARGVTITDEDREAARQSVYAAMGTDPTTGQSDPAVGQQQFEALDPTLQDLTIDAQATYDALAATITDEEAGVVPVSDEDVAAAFADREQEFTLRCGRSLLIDPTAGDQAAQEARATEIVAGIEDGEDFETFAEEETSDPATPPDAEIPCSSRSQFEQQLPPEVVDGMFETEPGNAFGPVVVQGAVFVVMVDDEQVTPRSEAEAVIRGELEGGNEQLRGDALQALIAELTLDAEVWVDPKYGTWALFDQLGGVTDDPDAAVRAGVAPPEGPEAPPVDSDTTAVIPDPATDPGVPAP